MNNLLTNKNALIFGVANKYSIAWAIAEQFALNGANIGISYAIEKLERRVRPLVEKTNAGFVEMCDVTSDEQIAQTMEKARAHFGTIDILVHAIAYAERDDLSRPFYQTSRQGFATALDVSAYSLVALAREAVPLMANGGSIMTLSYFGAEKVIPNYNVMGVAKAALEASVRYLAADLGPMGIRVNALSPGPIKTLSAGGVAGFRKMLGFSAEITPLRRNISQTEVAHSALWLASDLASGVTGEIIHVDAGYNIVGAPQPKT